jgi:hypothetical protein
MEHQALLVHQEKEHQVQAALPEKMGLLELQELQAQVELQELQALLEQVGHPELVAQVAHQEHLVKAQVAHLE